jgi:hypothetical protein
VRIATSALCDLPFLLLRFFLAKTTSRVLQFVFRY